MIVFTVCQPHPADLQRMRMGSGSTGGQESIHDVDRHRAKRSKRGNQVLMLRFVGKFNERRFIEIAMFSADSRILRSALCIVTARGLRPSVVRQFRQQASDFGLLLGPCRRQQTLLDRRCGLEQKIAEQPRRDVTPHSHFLRERTVLGRPPDQAAKLASESCAPGFSVRLPRIS